MLYCKCGWKKKITSQIGGWRPSFDKYLQVFQREYHISRNKILTEYSWDDIQNYVHDLPIDKVITLREGKNAKNQERYNDALCDRDLDGANSLMDAEYEKFMETRKVKN